MGTEQIPVRTVNWEARQGELYDLLQRQVRLYTMGDASSLPTETAQALLQSIRFCIEAHLRQGAGTDTNMSLETLFLAGQQDLWRLTEEGRQLLTRATSSDPGFESLALRDTLDSVESFFRLYDLRFFAHDIPCMIDYPLAQPVPKQLEGIDFIGEYLRRLILENRFCACFERRHALSALSGIHPEFRMLVLNLFEPVLTCALGLALLGCDPASLLLSVRQCGALRALLHPWGEESAERVRAAVGWLCARFSLWDSAMRRYLQQAAEGLLPTLQAASDEGYRNLFGAGSHPDGIG